MVAGLANNVHFFVIVGLVRLSGDCLQLRIEMPQGCLIALGASEEESASSAESMCGQESRDGD